MIARLTRTILLAELLLALLVAATFKWAGAASNGGALTGGLGVVLLLRLCITVNNFIVSSSHGSTTPSGFRLGPWQALALFAGEFRATLWSSSCALPFLSFERRPAIVPATLPVLLVHGWGCNSGYWHSMSRALQRADITHHAVSLEPMLGEIDGFVPIVHAAVEALCRESGSDSIVMVGHSMGGLVARAYLRHHGCARVTQVITLGSPHHGTVLANFGKGANSRQMHRHGNATSEWLARLNSEETAEARSRIVSLYSHHDNIIAPQTSSHLPGARNVELSGIGHVALALHPAIHVRVIEEIQRASEAVQIAA